MIKKGKRRWFALRHGTLYWFKSVQPLENITQELANGSLSLKLCTVASVDGPRHALAITPPGDGQAYQLQCYTAAELAAWVEALRAGLATASLATFVDVFAGGPQGLVFGVPLKEVLARERTRIPRIVASCVSFLTRHALDSPGLFRLSGSSSAVNRLKETFDRGEVVDFDKEEHDYDSCAGVLKLYLRQLPEPPITFELYNAFLDVANKADAAERMAQLVRQLPDANRALLCVLLRFMAQVIEHRETNQMNVNNLAIVFGPNLLRTEKLDMAVSLNDTPLVLTTARVLVNGHTTIFEPGCADDVDLPGLGGKPIPGAKGGSAAARSGKSSVASSPRSAGSSAASPRDAQPQSLAAARLHPSSARNSSARPAVTCDTSEFDSVPPLPPPPANEDSQDSDEDDGGGAGDGDKSYNDSDDFFGRPPPSAEARRKKSHF